MLSAYSCGGSAGFPFSKGTGFPLSFETRDAPKNHDARNLHLSHLNVNMT